MRSFLYALVAMAVLGSPFSAHAGCYGPVGRTDTSWLIALELRPEPSIIPQRMMLALLEANPDAFSSENVAPAPLGFAPDQPLTAPMVMPLMK